MASFDTTIAIAASPHAVYELLTAYSGYPRFLEDVQEVRQLDASHLHWRSQTPGGPREWDSEITEAIPERRIAWRNLNDHRNSGYVELAPDAPQGTQMHMHMEFDPPTDAPDTASATQDIIARTERDLERMKLLLQGGGMNA